MTGKDFFFINSLLPYHAILHDNTLMIPYNIYHFHLGGDVFQSTFFKALALKRTTSYHLLAEESFFSVFLLSHKYIFFSLSIYITKLVVLLIALISAASQLYLISCRLLYIITLCNTIVFASLITVISIAIICSTIREDMNA